MKVLKKNITYEDFNGNKQTETFYFNLTTNEAVDWNFGHEGGLEAFAKKVIETEDVKSMVDEFKKIILMTYGERSEDGKRFIKNDQLREEFAQSAAYDALFTELATDENALVAFLQGVMPAAVQDNIKKLETVQLPQPPSPPTTQ